MSGELAGRACDQGGDGGLAGNQVQHEQGAEVVIACYAAEHSGEAKSAAGLSC